MQRGTFLIALSAQAVEGGLVAHGESQPAFARSLLQPGAQAPAEEQPCALLETFVEQAGWERGMAVLVLPTAVVSFRRLHFSFGEPKKIRQVLPYELESELLDGVERYAFDQQIVPHPDGGTDVMVYLVEKAQLEACAAVLERHQLSLQRATFSAQALTQAHPRPQGRHCYVYVGSEEACLAYTLDGQLEALQSLEPHPGGLLGELQELGPGSPHDLLQALFRAGEEDAPRQALREKLRERLEGVREQVNRFLRINGGGEDVTVSVHGLFGELFEWIAGTASVSLRFPQGAWPGALRGHFGVLHELLGQPRAWPGRGLNFHRRIGTWVALAQDLRWPLVAAGVLLALLAGLAGTGVYLHTSTLHARLDTTSQELRRTLSLTGPITTLTVNSALSRLQERLDKARKEREAVAFLDRYHYDTLKMFRDLSEAIRQQSSVAVDSLSFNQERVTLSGTTPSYQDSEALRTRIAALERFKAQTVKITNSNVGQQIRFRLTVER